MRYDREPLRFELLGHAAVGFLSCFVIIHAEQDCVGLGHTLQCFQHRLDGGATTGHIAVGLPIPRVHRNVRQKIDGSLEYQQVPIAADMVKTVSRIAAFDVDAEGLFVTVGAADVGMPGNAAFILADEYRVVVLSVLIDQPVMGEIGENLAVDAARFGEVRETPPHVRIGFGQYEGLGFRLLPFDGLKIFAKESLHRFRKAHIVIFLEKADSVAAALFGMIVPLTSANGHAVIAGKPLFSAGADQPFASALEEGFEIRRRSLLLLCLGKGNVLGDWDHLGLIIELVVLYVL